MDIHPHLWLPFAGAVIGLPAIVLFSWLAFRNWTRLPKLRRSVFSVAVGSFGAAYGLAVYAWFIEPNMLVVHRATIASAAWHGPPLTIAAIGDTHVNSPHVSAQCVRRVVSRINALDPDLVVLLGDYMNTYAPASSRSEESRSSILDGIASFGALEALYGAVSVLGNRDARYGRAEITDALEDVGVAVLWNRHLVVPRSGGAFAIVGLADTRTGSPDFARAIDGAPEGADLIVLTHNPDAFAGLPDNIALTLAAHTHCGQVTVPLLGRLRVPSEYGQKYACHLVEEGARKMFVTSGIGTSGAPVRFLNPPEIAFLTLKGDGGA